MVKKLLLIVLFLFLFMLNVEAKEKGNVYEIMKNFDGGGHLTDAAAQLKNSNPDKVEQKLLKELQVLHLRIT